MEDTFRKRVRKVNADPVYRDIIAKLIDLPWRQTRTGLPGLNVEDLSDDQRAFIRDKRLDHGVLYYVQSSASLGEKPAYYTSVPQLMSKIVQKPEFPNSDDEQTEFRNNILANAEKLAGLVALHGEKRGASSPDGYFVCDEGAKELLSSSGVSNFRPDTGYGARYFQLDETPMGNAVRGILLLANMQKDLMNEHAIHTMTRSPGG